MGSSLDKLIAQREELEARIKAAKQRDKARTRKQETRRKVLLGAYTLERMKRDPNFEREVMADLGSYLTRDVDRAIFDFEPPPGETRASEVAAVEAATSPRSEVPRGDSVASGSRRESKSNGRSEGARSPMA